jgi:hypothetical protein
MRDGAVVVVAPRSVLLAGFFSCAASVLRDGRGEEAPEHGGNKPPPEAPAAEVRLKEVTSAPKHVSTSASVLLKSGSSDRRESRSGSSRSTMHSSWLRKPIST